MPLDESGRVFEVRRALIHFFERAAPEIALLLVAAGKGEKDRQRHLAVAEVVAEAFADLALARRKVEHVVDQLEGDPEIAAEPIERRLLLMWPFGDNRADAARRREQL